MAIPKQFCSLRGGDSLLHDALKRAEAIASPDHICAVVSQRHRRWWDSALSGVPAENMIVQPRNCGTANGILLPLLCILRRAVQELSSRCDQVLADPDLGYIVPGSRDGTVSKVGRFIEKPDALLARGLVDNGALWNAFIVVAKGAALLQLFIRRFPDVVNGMQQVVAQNQFTPSLSAAAEDLYHAAC